MNYFIALLAATAGSVVGALVLYWVGYAFGETRVRAIVDRRGKWIRLDQSDIDRADAWFDRHGAIAVMACRVVPIVRSLISIPGRAAQDAARPVRPLHRHRERRLERRADRSRMGAR